jgi:hypothetical protein
MKERKYYTKEFYKEQQGGSHQSASIILGIVEKVIRPKSIVDVGCGVGYWLKVWMENYNVQEVLGIEGPYVSERMLKIDPKYVLFQDLKQPINVGKRFDLAMSLEVAEHIPEKHADQFVKSLTGLSDVILFSAAIPGQEGTHHVNEQPPEYWAAKFLENEFVAVDYLRPLIWYNEQIDWWYRQNIMLFIKRSMLDSFPELENAAGNTDVERLLRIQPWLYMYKQEYVQKTRSLLGYIRWRLYPVKQFFLGKKSSH